MQCYFLMDEEPHMVTKRPLARFFLRKKSNCHAFKTVKCPCASHNMKYALC